MRPLIVVGMWLVATCGGCAHVPDAAPADDPRSDSAIARLRQENNTLKRRVQMLEDRVLMLEGPREVVPRQRASRSSTDTPRAHAASPALPVRRSVSLDPLPHSADPDVGAEEPSTWSDPDPSWSDDADAPEASRRYRLVGAHLVEQTKAKRSPPSPPRRGRAGREVVAQYDAAMAVYQSGDYAAAEQAFDAFARAHPDHDRADNALYWKGEAAYDQQHYADALAAFTEVVERYGGGNKAPDALLKIGLCYEKVGDLANARDVLIELVAAYPRARASDIARARLVELGA